MTTTPRTPDTQELAARVREHAAQAKVANAHLLADESRAWGRYARAVADVVEQLEEDLAEGRAALAEQRAERAAARHDAVEPLVDRAKAQLDELHVQEHLLAMEARDHLGERWDVASSALHRLRDALHHLLDAIRLRSGYEDPGS
jgi:hypothetical protein